MQLHDAFHLNGGQVQGYFAPLGQRTTMSSHALPIPSGPYRVLEQEGDIFRIVPMSGMTNGSWDSVLGSEQSYYIKASELDGVDVDYQVVTEIRRPESHGENYGQMLR